MWTQTIVGKHRAPARGRMIHPAHHGPRLAKSPVMVEIIHSQPGRRFQERYRRMHSKSTSAWKRCVFVAAGIVLTLVGAFFLAVPGPGIPILAVGLALVAQESSGLARWLDRTELRLRRQWKKLRRR